MALRFRDSEALVVALASGAYPADAAARVARTGDGGVIVEPVAPLAADALAALRGLGVAIDSALPDDARAIARCAEAIAAVRAPVAAIPPLVLFVAGAGAAVVDVAAELVRLGCDRLALMATADGGGVIRAVDPPTYSVERALDAQDVQDVRCFAPSPAGQEAVWTELGWRHPLAAQVRAAPGTIVL
ncbi:MAG TPA: hypothetical protein VFP84_11045, partial [Kofleriaceae bacterium]|nr:hypothetical protein [Kofleriaceae bacterium]